MPYYRDFRKKAFKNFDLDDIIYCHLSRDEVITSEDFLIRSSLHEMRDNMRHGHINRSTQIFTPLLCAFAILDQLGSSYRYLNVTEHPASLPSGGPAAEILKALYYFCGFPLLGPEASALYALRNSMMHDAAFVGKTRSGSWYFFRYDRDMQDIVKLALIPWDGEASTISHETTTYVNPRSLTTAVDAGIDTLFEAFITKRAVVQTLQSETDIRHKYLAWVAR